MQGDFELKELFAIEVYKKSGKLLRVLRGKKTWPSNRDIAYALATCPDTPEFDGDEEKRIEWVRNNLCARVTRYYTLA